MLNIVVCVKQVIDPEAPVSSFRIDVNAMRAIPPEGTPPVLSPYDENALEAALQIKDTQPAKITVVSAGARLAKAVLKRTLAVGADELILLEDERFQALDSFTTAMVLSAAIRKIGSYDLILCGRQASDTDAGLVGPGIAELLNLPVVTLTRKIVQVDDSSVRVERLLEDGFEIVQAPLPALLTISNEIGALRFATVKQITLAGKKPLLTWTLADLGLATSELDASARVKIIALGVPERETKVRLIAGTNAVEIGIELARALREAKII